MIEALSKIRVDPDSALLVLGAIAIVAAVWGVDWRLGLGLLGALCLAVPIVRRLR